MGATQTGGEETLRVEMDVAIEAPVASVFSIITGRFDEWLRGQEGESMKLTLEPFPGGRLWRDLGDAGGHLWGHVQVIKPPRLLEITGPLFVSAPCLSHLTFRLEEDGAGTRLQFTHRAVGAFPAEMGEGVNEGWKMVLIDHLKALCEGSTT